MCCLLAKEFCRPVSDPLLEKNERLTNVAVPVAYNIVMYDADEAW